VRVVVTGLHGERGLHASRMKTAHTPADPAWPSTKLMDWSDRRCARQTVRLCAAKQLAMARRVPYSSREVPWRRHFGIGLTSRQMASASERFRFHGGL